MKYFKIYQINHLINMFNDRHHNVQSNTKLRRKKKTKNPLKRKKKNIDGEMWNRRHTWRLKKSKHRCDLATKKKKKLPDIKDELWKSHVTCDHVVVPLSVSVCSWRNIDTRGHDTWSASLFSVYFLWFLLFLFCVKFQHFTFRLWIWLFDFCFSHCVDFDIYSPGAFFRDQSENINRLG